MRHEYMYERQIDITKPRMLDFGFLCHFFTPELFFYAANICDGNV